VVPCCMNSTTFLSQKTVAISFLADIFSDFLAYLMDALTAVWFQHSQMRPMFPHLLLIQCDRNSQPSLWYHSKKSQSRSHSLHFVHTHEHFWNPSCTKLVIT
jgi:exonuclease V gamma subunit